MTNGLSSRVVRRAGAFQVYSRRSRNSGLAGVSAVILLLAAGRWGAYIGYAPFFLTDLLLALAVLNRAFRAAVRPNHQNLVLGPRQSWPLVLLSLYFGWSLLRLATSAQPGLTGIRDAAPYLYAFVAALSVPAYLRASPGARRKTVWMLEWALTLHLAWVALALAVPSIAEAAPRFPGAKVNMFTIRGDFDTAIVGLLAAYSLRRILQGRKRGRDIPLLAASILVMSAMGSRSGLLAGIVSLIVAVLFSPRSGSLMRQRRTKLLLAGLVPLIMVGSVFLIPVTNGGARLLAGFNATHVDDPAIMNAAGTQHARFAAWGKIVSYGIANQSRLWLGVGFGPQFMNDSGASYALLGRADAGDVRSPHNYVLGTFARLGLIGVFLFLSAVSATAMGVVRSRRRLFHDDLAFLAAVAFAAIMVTSMLGVILESPFGAVPFFWFVGVLTAVGIESTAQAAAAPVFARRIGAAEDQERTVGETL